MTEALAQTSLHQVFDIWQPRYAERGIPTFPVAFTLCDGKIDKRPAVRGYMKLGLRASTELTRKFVDAAGIGFALGSKTGFAVADVDTPDESAVADVLAHYGSSPLIVRTPSGGFHVYYKHNGEQHRRVRHPYWRERGVPVDVLANGFVVAPPSRSPKGSYRFVQGYIDDLLRLPTMRALAAAYNIDTSPSDRRSPLCDMRDHEGRNNALFMALGPIARDIHRACGTREQLLGKAGRIAPALATGVRPATTNRAALDHVLVRRGPCTRARSAGIRRPAPPASPPSTLTRSALTLIEGAAP
jgi:Bifunctional DNA primase/polymerase, N-terminal